MYDATKDAEAYPATMNVISNSEIPRPSLASKGTYVKAESIAAPAIIWIVAVFKK